MKDTNRYKQAAASPTPAGILDLLPVTPSKVPFTVRVQELCLSSTLEEKILFQETQAAPRQSGDRSLSLTSHDEKELATEVLLLRHRFTEEVFRIRTFRQAALTVIQNIFLFRGRKIFFGTNSLATSTEREEALHLFSTQPSKRTIPLAKTFQHLIIARVWNRIISKATEGEQGQKDFITIHEIVEKLNTIRNIYMLLSAGLVKKLACQINDIYRESVTYEDAVQIGSFGIARAAYRYHQSCGVRFSTYAANWVFKEIQSQALKGRLIRISAHTVEGYARAARENNHKTIDHFSTMIVNATTVGQHLEDNYSINRPLQSKTTLPESVYEARQIQKLLHTSIDRVLPGKSGDIIKRRYGLYPYKGQEQSIITISKRYGVTRSSIYQQEQVALKKLHRHLQLALA